MPTPVARRTRSSRRSSVLRPEQTEVDDEIILTPGRPATRSRLSRAREKSPTPARSTRRRASRRVAQREGESEGESAGEEAAEEEKEGRQAEGGREGEASPQKATEGIEEEEEEDEDATLFLDSRRGREETAARVEEEEELAETESESEEKEEEELAETESESEETEDEDEEDEARSMELLQRLANKGRGEVAEAMPPPLVVAEATPSPLVVTSAQVLEEPVAQAAQSKAVVLLLLFCTVALVVTAGLLLFRASGGQGVGDGSAVTAMWSEDNIAFLTDQRIASTVQKDIAKVEAALRNEMADLVASQVNGKTSKIDSRVTAVSTELESLLARVGQIQSQVEEYRRAAASASSQRDEVASAAALEELQASQRMLEDQLNQLDAKITGLKMSSSVPAEQKEGLEEVFKQLSSLTGKLSVLQEAAGGVESLRSDMTKLLLEKQRQHDELVAIYTRDLEALLAQVEEAKRDSASVSTAVSGLTRSIEELSIPEMHAIEERVRVVVAAELAKQPVVKPGLERDHVQELIDDALVRENANRVEPLSRADVERLVETHLGAVETEIAALKHASESRAAVPPPPVVTITEEIGADIVEGERMRIMKWVQEAIDNARLPPPASSSTPAPAAPQAPPRSYVRPEDVNLDEIKTAVMQDVYKLLFADAVGKPDYALASVGGSIVDYSGKWSLGRLAGFLSPFPGRASSVEAIIEKDTTLGSCWPMAGSTGFVTVKLAQRVLIDSVSIEHVSSTIAHNQDSAPRDVRFWGYPSSGAKAIFLGQFTYDINGREVQTFAVETDTGIAVSLVKMEVMSNHGHSEYTCVYRLRVHGSPVELEL